MAQFIARSFTSNYSLPKHPWDSRGGCQSRLIQNAIHYVEASGSHLGAISPVKVKTKNVQTETRHNGTRNLLMSSWIF